MQSLSQWALPQLRQLLPLGDAELQQILDYASGQSTASAAEHLKSLIGDSEAALDFISAFNVRRRGATDSKTISNSGSSGGGGGNNNNRGSGTSIKLASASNTQIPSRNEQVEQKSRLPPSARGQLISDFGGSRKPKKENGGRAGGDVKATVQISGGVSMQGQGSNLKELDAAIKTVEAQLNRGILSSADDAERELRRRCNCMATRHPLLTAAPNCLACGKIVCVKEGLGPCTFCGRALLTAAELHSMARVLREERGQERMAVHNTGRKRAEVASSGSSPSPSPETGVDDGDDATETARLSAAVQHRDRLLAFQASNAQRTRIRDEAADFDGPGASLNMWASPQERALQLRKQQRVLQQQEWNAKQDYEKREMVVSLDLSSGKAVKRMVATHAPLSLASDADGEGDGGGENGHSGDDGGGGAAPSRNPLAKGLIKPVARAAGKERSRERPSARPWRRVQDDQDDREEWAVNESAMLGYSDEPS